MKWEELGRKIVESYGKVSVWVYDNPVETDALIGLVVVGSCVWYWRRRRRKQLRAFRIIRGALMKRKDREKFHLMAFEDAIVNKALDMIVNGEMSEAEEKRWYDFFATQYGMTGLVPMRDNETIKRGINFRLVFWGVGHRRLSFIPGGIPGEGTRVDKTYQPVLEEPDTRRSSSTSRYLNGG